MTMPCARTCCNYSCLAARAQLLPSNNTQACCPDLRLRNAQLLLQAGRLGGSLCMLFPRLACCSRICLGS